MVIPTPDARILSLVETSPEPTLGLDSRMRLVLFNSAAENLLGYHRQEVLGGPLTNLLPEGLGAIPLARLQRAVAQGREGEVEQARVSVRHCTGYRLPAEATLSLLRDEGDSFHVIATLKGLTDEQIAERNRQVIHNINHYLALGDPWPKRLHKVHTELQRSLSSQWMGLLLFKPDQQRARLLTRSALYPDSKVEPGLELEYSGWLARMATRGDTVLAKIRPRGGHSLEKRLYLEGLRQLLVQPLYVQEQIIGALVLASMASKGFHRDHGALVEELAPQMALALTNELDQYRLASSQRRYRELLESLHEAVFRCDISGRLQFANPALARLLGYPDPTSLLAQAPHLPLRQNGEGQGLVDRVEAAGGQASFELELVDSRGQLLKVKLSAHLVVDREGRPLALEGTLQDLSEAERLNLALKESEARFQKVFSDAADYILLADERGLITDVNEAAQRLLGLTKADLLGRPVEEALSLSQMALTELQREETVAQQVRVVTRAGERVGLWQTAELVDDDQGRYIRAVGHPEQTEAQANRQMESCTRELEARLAAHRQGLDNAEQLAELGRMVAALANHLEEGPGAAAASQEGVGDYLERVRELVDRYASLASRTETTPELEEVMASLEQLRDRLLAQATESAMEPENPSPPQRGEGAAGAMAEAMAEALANQELEGGQLELIPINLNEAVEASLKQLESQLREKATVLFEPGQLNPVLGVREQLDQVLMNLLLNAAEAMRQMGTIKVATRAEGEWAIVEIADDGVGLSKGELKRIFDPFYTTKSEAQGLGLTISNRIVGAHGGTIQVSSQKNAGSTFCLQLPVTPSNGEGEGQDNGKGMMDPPTG